MKSAAIAAVIVLGLNGGCGDGGHARPSDAAITAADATPDAPSDAPVCMQTTCGPGCVDTMTDVDNCGACGHVCGCGSTTCTAGVCDSHALASDLGGPVVLGLNAGTLYWGDDLDANLSTVSVAGGGATVLTPGITAIRGLAFDATDVFISRFNFNVVDFEVLGGGGNVSNFANSREGGADGIVVDASSLYWADYGDGTIRTIALASGGGATGGTTLATGQTHPDQLAEDADHLYWTTNYNGGAVITMPKTGGTPVALASNLANPHGIAVDNTYVYWTEQGDGVTANTGSVNRVAIADGAVTVLAAAQPSPNLIALDAAFIYWTDLSGAVMRAPLTGTGSATPVAAEGSGKNPEGLVVTPTCLYFADYGDGSTGTGSIRSHDLQ